MYDVPASPELDEALVDPVTWADEERIHAYLAWLRANDPVRRLAPEGYEPFYAITKHADVMAVEKDKQGFVNDPRPTLAPILVTEAIQQLTGRRHLVRSLVQMDDPDHMKYRMLTQAWFTRQRLEQMRGTVEALAKEYVDRLADLGGECDFVKDVAIWYPLRVIMSVLGVPEEDEPYMLKLTQELFGSTDPDVQRSFDIMAIGDVVRDFEAYFLGISEDRRRNPRDDVASVIANATIDGAPIGDLEAAGYYIIVATAGHDTTSSSTSGGLLALLENPDEFAKLRADPEKHVAGAVEEMIRWVSPVRHFMRTATRDHELRGTTIREGESVILWYPSANRDEEVFDAPFEFRIERPAARNLAFGYGAHVCLGQHLARLEIQALYRELLARVEHVELAGEPKFAQAAFVGGLKSLPIRYRMK
ncbi:MAG: cytochrome P450 [Pseudomonadales bacterium]|jgi:cytochrome P450|nr:cytochrome P450 [Pseudomonadales bacterium]